MNKPRKVMLLLAAALLLLSAAACHGKSSQELPQRSLCIVWPTLNIDFYSTMADVMKGQAEDADWEVQVVSYEFDSSKQAQLLEDCGESGVTDIITCAQDPGAIEDICIRLREQGVNISMFSMAPDNPEAYDSVTVADQYRIGQAIAKNASDWVNETFPEAKDGSIDAAIIQVPSDAENIKRAQGMETISENPKINVAYTCALDGEDPAGAKNAIDKIMQEYPDVRVVLCHFSSLAQAADDAALSYERLDRSSFGIFSGDWDAELASRLQASVNNDSLIRATGTYATDAMEIQFHVCTGEYNRLLNEQKQYVFPVVSITARNIDDYLN